MKSWDTTVYLLLLTVPGLYSLLAKSKFVNVTLGRINKFNISGPQEVILGSSPDLNCGFHLRDNVSQVRVSWLFSHEPHLVLNQDVRTLFFKVWTHMGARKTTEHANELRRDIWLVLPLRNFQYNDSGWYFCEVTLEIPQFKQYLSDGIHLTVKNSSQKVHSPVPEQLSPSVHPPVLTGISSWFVGVIAAAGTVVLMLLITVIVTIWTLCKKRRLHQRIRENPIYENMHPAAKGAARNPGMQMNGCSRPPLEHLGTPRTPRLPEAKWSPKPYI